MGHSGSSGHRDDRSDEELVAALNAGDASAFDALYYRYREWVARLAYRFTQNEQDALDVVQETFAYLAGKFPGLELRAAMTTLLYPVVRHTAVALRRKRRPELIDDEALDLPAPVDPPDAGVQRAELSAVLASLPQGQREVLLMRFVDDMQLVEIAAALDVPTGTVKSRLHNALKTLRADPRTARYFL